MRTSRSSSSLVDEFERRRYERRRERRQNGDGDGVAAGDSDLEEPLLPRTRRSQVELEDERQRQQSQQPADERTKEERKEVSRNVKLTLAFTCVAFVGRSIWSQSVLATFVFLLEGGNHPEAVGYVTAVMGISQLLTSFPSGFLADRYRRDSMLKLASMFGVAAICLGLLACRVESYRYVVAALGAWGGFFGVANTSLTALFADSIPDGGHERTKYFTRRSILRVLGNTAGPLVALSMFGLLGDKWTRRDCAIVIAIGQFISLPAVLLLCFFNDDLAVSSSGEEQRRDGNHAQEEEEEEAQPETAAGTDEDDDALVLDGQQPPEKLTDPLLLASLDRQESGYTTQPEETATTDSDCGDGRQVCDAAASDGSGGARLFGLVPGHRVVPVFVTCADLLAGLGSGMSIRYFPIFFVDNLKLHPVAVQSLYATSPVLMAALMRAAQSLAKRHGSFRVAVGLKWTGISLMVLMILSYRFCMPTWVVCAVYVLRTAFVNSTGALTRSALMDSVPKKERGKWAALESVNMFSWSGSAVVGGLLVGRLGMLPLFCITASVQFVATLPLAALFDHDNGRSSNFGAGEGRPTSPRERTASSNYSSSSSTSSSTGSGR